MEAIFGSDAVMSSLAGRKKRDAQNPVEQSVTQLQTKRHRVKSFCGTRAAALNNSTFSQVTPAPLLHSFSLRGIMLQKRGGNVCRGRAIKLRCLTLPAEKMHRQRQVDKSRGGP